ncbi:threonine/serine exporter family protein [uncultured Campylobacter sp.]|uniref:threonine/serine exporter family protein n=1 Tax=uncultured Campylobacter sp. TaxID=218934 RepID=UPI0026074063|nr:threonine/serine exporter family protein [uncultured Campylobacter sp.]
MMFSVLMDMFFAALAGFAFAYNCSPPLRTLLLSAALAAIGHGFRFTLIEFFNIDTLAIATFLASFLVGCLGMICAKISKTPAEIIAFPALLPMIPGIYAYRTVLYLFSFFSSDDLASKTRYLVEFFDYFLITLSVTLSLAIGVSITLILFFEQSLMVTRHSSIFDKYKKYKKKHF